MARITIDSILGGESPTSHFAAKDQFSRAVGIDPALPYDDLGYLNRASGVLRPSAVSGVSATLNAAPLWMVRNPKNSNVYIYDHAGSTYTYNFSTVTGLSDLADGGTATGNGAAYYDNYLYFSRDTTIARYGPLDGVASFTNDYWVTTLSKTALDNTNKNNYPWEFWTGLYFPNHTLYRHSDGKLYVCDVVNNQGTLHYISTTKTTVEGDTDNGSKYSALTFGYGLYPTALASYGSSLAIALNEAPNAAAEIRAKLAFWDTTSQNFNSITWVEFPDPVISAMVTVDGVLYLFSGSTGAAGVRITKYIGGTSFEEVDYLETAMLPFQGAVNGESSRLLFGTLRQDLADSTTQVTAGCVYSMGLQKGRLSKGLFSILSTPTDSASVTALIRQASSYYLSSDVPHVGFSTGSSGHQIGKPSVLGGHDYSTSPIIWRSQQYNIGQPFTIKRIRIPLTQVLAANMTVVPKLYFDNQTKTQTLTTINSTNFPSTGPGMGLVANIKTAGDGANILMGQNSFYLELQWTGSALCTVDLPILIDFDLIPD